MIRITISSTGIRISSHSGAATYGYDIVCAAMSAIVQIIKAGAEEFTDDSMESLCGFIILHFQPIVKEKEGKHGKKKSIV